MESNVIFDQKVINGFAHVLTYAACEWFLIFLMFIDALLSYLLVWFARYCRLQMPCFLCSKLLHPLHWRFLICTNHRSEVSSFMSCHNHNNNLADCRSMCDDCLLSFTKMTGPNPDMNRLLLGKLGYDLLSKSHFAHPRSCSCCNKPWRTRHNTQRLIRLGSRGRNSTGIPNIPAPRNLSRRGSLKKRRTHKATSGTEVVDIGSRSDCMAHVGYKELKIQSDFESEFLFSDEDAFLQITDFNAEPSEKHVHKSVSWKLFEDNKMLNHKNKKIHETVKSSMPELKLVVKTDQQQEPVEAEEHEAVFSELITMSEARPFSLDLHLPQEVNKGTTHNENEAEVSGNSSPSAEEFLSPSAENAAYREVQIQTISDSDMKIDMEKQVSDHMNVSETVANEPSSDEENIVEGDYKPLMFNDMSVSLEQEQYFSNEEDEVNGQSDQSTSKYVSDSFSEEQSSEEEEDESNGYSVAKSHSSNEENMDNGDYEPFKPNNVTCSATEEDRDHEETEPLISPKLPKEEYESEHIDKDTAKVTSTQSTSNGSSELKHSASRESFVSISSNIEGESLVDVLKQQLESDKRSLRDLSKELEEERNASAIATNQAMAMITRLQEEKATLHMEALQYLRMMEEQAEHDLDALERANDVLAGKEKQIQDLEIELEYYRVKYPNESREEILASMGIFENIETSYETREKVTMDKNITGSISEEI